MAKMAVQTFILQQISKENKNMTISNPVVNKVYTDLDEFRNYCTTELDRLGNPLPFDEADLYNEKSKMWVAFKKWRGWKRAVARAEREGRPVINNRKR